MPMKFRPNLAPNLVHEMDLDQKILALTIERNIIAERLAEIIKSLVMLEAQREG